MEDVYKGIEILLEQNFCIWPWVTNESTFRQAVKKNNPNELLQNHFNHFALFVPVVAVIKDRRQRIFVTPSDILVV